jgi:acetoacetyl-CoA synthetase
VEDSLCVGQRRPSDNDERVVLFLKMKQGVTFTADLVSRVRAAIRQRLSARHVPSYIFPVPDIPVSVSIYQCNCLVRV